MGFFYRHTPRKFNYIPRFYDPELEARKQKRAEMGLDTDLSHEEQLRFEMRRKWGRLEGEETKEEKRNRLIRRILWGAFLLFVFYFVFCTPLLTNVVGGLMGR